MSFFPCGQTRREFVWQMGGGFAGLALTSMLDQDGFFGRHAAASDNVSEASRASAAFHGQSQSLHLSDDEWGSQSGRYVRLQAVPAEVRRTAAAGRQSIHKFRRAESRISHAGLSTLSPWRRKRPADFRLLSERATTCRQTGRHPFVPHRQPRTRIGAGRDEYRQDVYRPTVTRIVVRLWYGD